MSDATMPSTDASAALQFDKAEFEAPQQLSCVSCKRPLSDVYYSANGKAICASCQGKFVNRPAATSKGLLRGGLRGLGATLVCGLVWGVITEASGYNLGIVAVFVGYLIGREVARGSRQGGGWPYQALAIALTYCSIVVSYLPAAYKFLMEHGQNPASQDPVQLAGFALGLLMGPVWSSISHPLSGLIYGFALYQAWKVTRRAAIQFAGPLPVTRVAAPPVVEASSIVGEPSGV